MARSTAHHQSSFVCFGAACVIANRRYGISGEEKLEQRAVGMEMIIQGCFFKLWNAFNSGDKLSQSDVSNQFTLPEMAAASSFDTHREMYLGDWDGAIVKRHCATGLDTLEEGSWSA